MKLGIQSQLFSDLGAHHIPCEMINPWKLCLLSPYAQQRWVDVKHLRTELTLGSSIQHLKAYTQGAVKPTI